MKAKPWCTQNNGDCSTCSLVSYGLDCINNPVDSPEEEQGTLLLTSTKKTTKRDKIMYGFSVKIFDNGNTVIGGVIEVPCGADPVGFLETIASELIDLRAESVKLKGIVSIKQDRVNNLEKALRDALRQLEKAINGNAMDGDWIAAELHGRECLYSQA